MTSLSLPFRASMMDSSKSFPNIKSQFPIFEKSLKDWAYLDNAATTQKPEAVIQSITKFHTEENANIHRGLYPLSAHATRHYEEVRSKVKSWLGAQDENEIAFTHGTTESINIVANSFAHQLKEGDEILITAMEHHANLIPWQEACHQAKATLNYIPLQTNGDLALENFSRLLTPKTRLVSLTHISNTLGTVNPIPFILEEAHKRHIPVMLDAAQSVGHTPVNISDLDIDFLAFSAHKMFGPMGSGVLYVNRKHHALIRPLNYGGGAIKEVSLQNTKLRDYPFCLEAGTPNISGVIGLGEAIDFLTGLDTHEMDRYTRHLAHTFREALSSLPFVSLVGHPAKYSGIVSFVVDGIHAHDVAGFLADKKIAVRAGHHCTQPLYDQLGLPATVRASFSIYNSSDEIDRVKEALINLKKFWA